MTSDVRTIDSIEHIRRHPELYFYAGRPTPLECATRLSAEALLLSALEVSIARAGRWWVVGAEIDWMAHETISIVEQFRRLVPFPQSGPNCARFEVVVSAFAESIVVLTPDTQTRIAGNAVFPERVLELASTHRWKRAIAFCFAQEKET